MTSALWKQRSDVLICLLIQSLLIVIGQSLQGLQLRLGGETTQAQPTVSTLDNLNNNDQKVDSSQATYATESEQSHHIFDHF